MLTTQGYIDFLNDNSRKAPKHKSRWEDVYYGMSLHIDGACPSFISLKGGGLIHPPNYFGSRYQYLFENYLLTKHPRENPDTLNWRMSQYRPWTKDPFSRAISFIRGSIFQDGNYYFKVENEDADNYIWGSNFSGNNLITSCSTLMKSIFTDPNGLIVAMPENDNISLIFVYSKDILLITDDEVVFERDEYVWIINKGGYLRVKKEKSNRDYKRDSAKVYFSRKMDNLPYVVAGGIWNANGYFDSWLDGAKAYADEFVSTKSSEQLVNKEAAHPFIIAASEECPDCTAGQIQWCDGCKHSSETCTCDTQDFSNLRLVKCPSCGGSGNKSRNPSDWMIADKEDMDKQLIRIVNPDVSINEHWGKVNKDIYEGIIASLHLSWIEQAQSGIAKERDAETRYQFVLSISNDVFGRILPKMIDSVLVIKYGKTFPHIISKPTQFSIKTSGELLLDYQLSTQAGMPNFIRAMHLRDYTDKMFGGDFCAIKKTEVIIQLDKFAVSSDEEIKRAVEMGAATDEDWQFHINLPSIIDQCIRERSKIWFMSADFAEIEKYIRNNFVFLKPDKDINYGKEEVRIEETDKESGNRSYGRG